MKILVLGLGMQGKTAVYDLYHNQSVSNIIVADLDKSLLERHIQENNYQDKMIAESVNAENLESVKYLFSYKPDVVIDLLPVKFNDSIAEIVIKNGLNLVNTNYVTPKLQSLAETASDHNVTFLPEFGLDPGIDLVLLGRAIQEFDEILEINSYGGGLPDKEAVNNILKYKVTWSLEGVLKTYTRPSKLIKEFRVVDIAEGEIFNSENLHYVEVEGVGKLEAFPNGNAVRYIKSLNLDNSKIKSSGRYALRYPGHGKIWKSLIELQLLSDKPIDVNGNMISPRKFLEKLLEPQLELRDNERDVVIIRLEILGKKKGNKIRKIIHLIDRRDLETGFTAMSRTVGFTASIGAFLIGSGHIKKSGLISPIFDIPYDLFLAELKKRNIYIKETETLEN
ncbi:MAG: saccharopine dehydrogenase family protein [Candidatus Kariarchaeaceae archaeon]|jgi:saccharopine dehydrogenase-like NADP-dependent oxidoreductase